MVETKKTNEYWGVNTLSQNQSYEEKLAHYKEWVKLGKTLEETAISELESLLSYLEKTTPENFDKTIPYLALPYLALQEQRREIDTLRKKVEGISK